MKIFFKNYLKIFLDGLDDIMIFIPRFKMYIIKTHTIL